MFPMNQKLNCYIYFIPFKFVFFKYWHHLEVLHDKFWSVGYNLQIWEIIDLVAIILDTVSDVRLHLNPASATYLSCDLEQVT